MVRVQDTQRGIREPHGGTAQSLVRLAARVVQLGEVEHGLGNGGLAHRRPVLGQLVLGESFVKFSCIVIIFLENEIFFKMINTLSNK